MAGENSGTRSRQECAGDRPGHPSIQITSRSTRERIYLSILPTVRRSTFLPKRSSRKYTSGIKLSKVACPSANSTVHPHRWYASAHCGQRIQISRSVSHRTVNGLKVPHYRVSGIPDSLVSAVGPVATPYLFSQYQLFGDGHKKEYGMSALTCHFAGCGITRPECASLPPYLPTGRILVIRLPASSGHFPLQPRFCASRS